jgi:hypothetical protein
LARGSRLQEFKKMAAMAVRVAAQARKGPDYKEPQALETRPTPRHLKATMVARQATTNLVAVVEAHLRLEVPQAVDQAPAMVETVAMVRLPQLQDHR